MPTPEAAPAAAPTTRTTRTEARRRARLGRRGGGEGARRRPPGRAPVARAARPDVQPPLRRAPRAPGARPRRPKARADAVEALEVPPRRRSGRREGAAEPPRRRPREGRQGPGWRSRRAAKAAAREKRRSSWGARRRRARCVGADAGVSVSQTAARAGLCQPRGASALCLIPLQRSGAAAPPLPALHAGMTSCSSGGDTEPQICRISITDVRCSGKLSQRGLCRLL